MPPTENTLDLLMSMDPLELSDEQIDEQIKFLRQQRMMVEHGVTPKKAKTGPKVDLSNIVSAITMTTKEDREEDEESDRRF